MLCNAMVWTCELTGRPGLTYAEALESETKARKCLANVPKVRIFFFLCFIALYNYLLLGEDEFCGDFE